MKWLRGITCPMTENNCNWNSKKLKLEAEKIFASQESLVSHPGFSKTSTHSSLSLAETVFF